MTIYTAADLLTGLVESLMMFMLYGTFCKKRENVPPFVYMMGLILLAIIINISNIMSDYGILNSIGMTLAFFCSFVFIQRKYKNQSGNICFKLSFDCNNRNRRFVRHSSYVQSIGCRCC